MQEVDGLRAETERQRAQREEAERQVVARDNRIAQLEARAAQEMRQLEVRGMGRQGAMAAHMHWDEWFAGNMWRDQKSVPTLVDSALPPLLCMEGSRFSIGHV